MTQRCRSPRVSKGEMDKLTFTPLLTRGLLHFFAVAVLTITIVGTAFAQPAPNKPKEIFRDANGDLISNNEFVDLRLANPSAKDPATRIVLEDGTIEFKVASPLQEGTLAPTFEAPDIDAQWITKEKDRKSTRLNS